MARKKAEVEQPEEGSWSSLRKTIIATLTTLIAGGGVWLSTILFGGSEEPKEEVKTEQTAPAQSPVINLNVDNSSKNSSNSGGGSTTIIKERVVEKPVEKKEEKKKDETDSPW